MKKILFAVAAAALFAASATTASAAGCQGPLCQQPAPTTGLFGKFFGKQPLPAFQAAPWYLYWPYNAHFMTPAPLTGPYYAPPPAGLGNPYFPAAPGYGYPVPGGGY